MSIAAILGLVYGAGVTVGLFYCGVSRVPLWDTNWGFPRRGCFVFVWPLLVPLAPLFAGKAYRRHLDRVAIAAEEQRKLLREAGLE